MSEVTSGGGRLISEVAPGGGRPMSEVPGAGIPEVTSGGGTPIWEVSGGGISEVTCGGGDSIGVLGPGSVISTAVDVTGHTVVEIAMVDVTITVESAGQEGTSGAQLVMVTSDVA